MKLRVQQAWVSLFRGTNVHLVNTRKTQIGSGLDHEPGEETRLQHSMVGNFGNRATHSIVYDLYDVVIVSW